MSTSAASLPLRWQDKTTLVLGLLLLVSPWALGYATAPSAAWNAWALGTVFVLGSGLALADLTIFVEWMVAFGGLWLFLSPRILAFTDHTLATVEQMAFGVAIAVLALWSAIAASRARNAAASARPPARKAA